MNRYDGIIAIYHISVHAYTRDLTTTDTVLNSDILLGTTRSCPIMQNSEGQYHIRILIKLRSGPIPLNMLQ